MPSFDLILEQVQPFDGIDLPTDVRISGTYRDRDNYTIDHVEMPGRQVSDGWRIINRTHPLWTHAFGRIVDSPATADLIDAVIRAEMEADRDASLVEEVEAWL